MLRKLLFGVAGSIILLLGFNAVEAGELEMEPFLFTQGFEEVDPVAWWTGAKHTVNFKGLTEDRAYAGRRSFKLDVTFQEAGRLLWQIPVRVPAAGRLNFSGRIFLGAESTSERVGLGVNVNFPPTWICGGWYFGSGEKGEWRLIEKDLVEFGKELATASIPRRIWGATTENVGIRVDRIGLFLWGGPEDRVVVYLDDFKIEGEVPTEKAFREEIKRRWAPARARFEEKISSWEEMLRAGEENIALLTDLPEAAEKLKREVEARISSTKERIAAIRGRGWINPGEHREIDPFLGQLEGVIRNIKLVAEGRGFEDMLVYVVPPISGLKILPFDPVIERGAISDEIRVIATPGEYEPASFVVTALTNMNLLAEVTDLQGKEGVIPSENIEINIVKCWFQDSGGWVCLFGPGGEPVLVPELLLNDARLVKVDHERVRNYLRLVYPDGEIVYRFTSCPAAPHRLERDDWPVKDAPDLLPVNIPAGRNQQFWVTVKVPDAAPAGLYTGKITLSTEEETLATLTLKVKVLPFTLSPPMTNHPLEQPFVSSLYHFLLLGEGSLNTYRRNEQQFRAELENMVSHGVTNPTAFVVNRGREWNSARFIRTLEIRREVEGLINKPLFLATWGGCFGNLGFNATLEDPLEPSELEELKQRVKQIETEVEQVFGHREVYFHGMCEARGEMLAVQRPAWEAIRKAGGRMWVASYTAGWHPPGNFALMGDIQDLAILAGVPCKEEAARWHAVGHRVFTYANPQTGIENPEIYRRNFGLSLWLHNYDGAMTFIYHHPFGGVWNDFDYRWRDHNFVYPTVDGVINTIAWAGYREGVDDIRYGTTLRLAIREAKESGDSRLKRKAAEAESYLEGLLEQIKAGRCLDTIRLEIIGYILRLR